MSGFEQIASVLAEQANCFDVLRIIARDSRALGREDRAAIHNAADELEDVQRKLVKLSFEYCQLQQQLIAVNDQLLDARAQLAKKPPVSSPGVLTEYDSTVFPAMTYRFESWAASISTAS